MPARVTQRRRVGDEASWSVKPCQEGRIVAIVTGCDLTVPSEEAPANSVPAAAVTRGERALFGITGCKGLVGGEEGRM